MFCSLPSFYLFCLFSRIVREVRRRRLGKALWKERQWCCDLENVDAALLVCRAGHLPSTTDIARSLSLSLHPLVGRLSRHIARPSSHRPLTLTSLVPVSPRFLVICLLSCSHSYFDLPHTHTKLADVRRRLPELPCSPSLGLLLQFLLRRSLGPASLPNALGRALYGVQTGLINNDTNWR